VEEEQEMDVEGGKREERRTSNVLLVDEDVRNGTRVGLLSEVSLHVSKRLSRQYVRATRNSVKEEDETKRRTFISAPSSSRSKSWTS
jgi:hypothetical protein